MLRIIGSDTPAQMELVSHEDLRAKMNLTDGMAVRVTVWEFESNWKRPTPAEMIAQWCEAASHVEENYGIEKALGYLIGEKFLNFLDGAQSNRELREAIPIFVAEIKTLFDGWEISQFLNTPRRLGALGHASTELGHRLLREGMTEEERLREDARNLMMLEWAKELLLEE